MRKLRAIPIAGIVLMLSACMPIHPERSYRYSVSFYENGSKREVHKDYTCWYSSNFETGDAWSVNAATTFPAVLIRTETTDGKAMEIVPIGQAFSAKEDLCPSTGKNVHSYIFVPGNREDTVDAFDGVKTRSGTRSIRVISSSIEVRSRLSGVAFRSGDFGFESPPQKAITCDINNSAYYFVTLVSRTMTQAQWRKRYAGDIPPMADQGRNVLWPNRNYTVKDWYGNAQDILYNAPHNDQDFMGWEAFYGVPRSGVGYASEAPGKAISIAPPDSNAAILFVPAPKRSEPEILATVPLRLSGAVVQFPVRLGHQIFDFFDGPTGAAEIVGLVSTTLCPSPLQLPPLGNND